MENSVFFQNLEPFSFLERSAFVYPDKPAVVYNETVYTYREFRDRVNRLAGALKSAGVGRGERVAFIVPNLPALLEGHYGPMSIGAVLVAINTRLSPREIAYILNHSKAKGGRVRFGVSANDPPGARRNARRVHVRAGGG